MKFIDKIENGTFTKEEMKDIENDYRKKELFDTVSKAGTKELFLNEVANNNEFTSEDIFNSEGAIQPSQSLLQKLAKNSNLYDNLLNASQDNARRTDTKNDKLKVKKVKSVINKKEQTHGSRSI